MKLQFTNGYRPRFDQISRIMQYLLTRKNQKRIPRKEIVANLGIPDKQVENLTSMMTGFGLVTSRTSTLTSFGKIITKADPYFEKVDTLWIIHYIVSSDQRWVVWYRIMNTVIPAHDDISIDLVSNTYFNDLASHYSVKTYNEKLPKEIGAVLASYTRSELSRLKILDSEGVGKFIRGTPIEVTSLVFLFCLVNFRDRFSPGSSAINVEDISIGDNSPGRVLYLPKYKVRNVLTELNNRTLLRLEQFGNLDQVRFSDSNSQENILGLIYGETDVS